MRWTAALLGPFLVLATYGAWCSAQETQAVPTPVTPTPKQTTNTQQSGTQTQKTTAPVVRRQVAHPNAGSTEPVDGPMTGAGAAGQGTVAQTPVTSKNSSIDADTIRAETRLVNVALNVVDAHGAPVGGFERQDFQIFEDGKPQTIAVFDREATSPLSIVLAIDASETVVTSDRLEREAAKHFVTAILRPQDQICLMDFADTVREVVPFTNQAKRIDEGLGNLQHGDETALYNAVYLASQRLATTSEAAGRRRVLVLISDGGDSVAGKHYEEAVEEAQRAGAIVYSIIIVPIAADAGRNTGGEHTLIQMSEDTGGKYYYVTDPKGLEPAFQHISDDLRTQYLLGYYAPLQVGESGFRRIKVKMTDATLDATYNLRYRTGYFADTKP
ncbi:MAG TPA: VWA domain-containing protein [Acidobacteriaceae bacterium]|jgi:Ca-activated chloride channel family protein|nr:VWA domain-containing protein [Acidobacteriaceae bacterium]